MNNADQFAALCKKYGVAIEDYAETFRRPVDAAIQAIGRPNYSEGFWFTPYKERLKAGEDKFRELLKERDIDPDTYEQKYKRRIRDAAYNLQWGVEIDMEWWLTVGVNPTLEEAEDMFREELQSRGLTLKTYCETYYHTRDNALKVFTRKIRNVKHLEDPLFWDKVFTPSEKDTYQPETILKEASDLVGPERSAGLTPQELPKKLRKKINDIYRGGLDQINKDLKLRERPKTWEQEEIEKPIVSKNAEKIDKINRKIDRLTELLDPKRILKLQEELTSLSEQKENEELPEADVNSNDLLETLRRSVENALEINCGYLYFKQWNLNETTWYKIGITNSPKRRDNEQNVLPVPAETIFLLRLDSMEQARSLEKAFHRALENRRVKGALNKEIFQLKRSDYKSVMIVLRELRNRLEAEKEEDELED